jgi:hypothetical protein
MRLRMHAFPIVPILLAGSLLAQASPLPMTEPKLPADARQTLVLDVPASARTINNLRSSLEVAKLPAKLDATGLAALKMYGSAEFTPAALARWRRQIKGPLTIFDLRQEAHGFAAGNAITWYAQNDWGQVGLDHDEALEREAQQLNRLRGAKSITVSDARVVKAAGSAPVAVTTLHRAVIQSEQEVAVANAAGYVRLMVTDHVRPTDAVVDQFIASVRELPQGSSVYFHCRAGQGRTTTFMVMYDMLRNAGRVSFDNILKRQAALGHDYDVGKLPVRNNWKFPYQQDRARFIHAFYAYAKDNPGGLPKTWTEWQSLQP